MVAADLFPRGLVEGLGTGPNGEGFAVGVPEPVDGVFTFAQVGEGKLLGERAACSVGVLGGEGGFDFEEPEPAVGTGGLVINQCERFSRPAGSE